MRAKDVEDKSASLRSRRNIAPRIGVSLETASFHTRILTVYLCDPRSGIPFNKSTVM